MKGGREMSKSIKPEKIIDELPNDNKCECCDLHTRFTWALIMSMLLADGLQIKQTEV